MQHEGGMWARAAGRLAPFLDIAIAVAATALSIGALFAADVENIDPRLEGPDAVAIVGTVIATGALYWRRTYPTIAYAAFGGGCLVVTLTGHYIGLLSVLLLFALYSLAAYGRRRHAAVALVATILTFACLAAANIPDLRTSDLLQAWALVITAWAIGDAIRARRGQHRDQLLAAEHDAALAREQTGRAVAEERLRIARELHDVVAHSMSLIAVQAGVGAHVIRTDVDAAERALQIVAETSREALAQTRSMLGVLRQEDDPVSGPVPQGIDDIPALVAVVQTAGVDIDLEIEGAPTRLDPAVELAAYRIVQESLTNVLKHGGPRAHVQLTYRADELDIEITDPGGRSVAPSQDSGGHGLSGLRERAHLVSGRFTSGPTPDGGFRAHATLPLTENGS
ncbi:MAG: hypothetical protein C0482_18630 [Gordonia sp.]|nr:hypothetical protein [Gordonia sp. (in: high G+C Gram-positive bacteria)]